VGIVRLVGSPVARLVASPAVLVPPLLLCYAITAAIHLASVVLSTLLPFHVVDLGGSRTQIGLVFSVMTVVSMVLRPAVGGWIDGFGARPVIVPGLAVLAVSAVALQAVGDPAAVIAVMAVAGVGFALVGTPGSILAARASDAAHRGEALSLYYLASSFAIAVAPPLALGLRALGGIPLGYAVVAVFLAVILALVLALPHSIAAAVTRARARFAPVSRSALRASSGLVLASFGYSSMYAFVPLYAVGRGQGHVVVWFFAVYSAWVIVWRAALRRLSDRIGRRAVIVPAMALTALGYFVLALPPTPVSLIGAAVILASGASVLYPTLVALVLDLAPERERGVAMGTVSAAWDLGVVLGSALIGFVADRVSFGAGFAVAGAAAGAGTIVFVRTTYTGAKA
jgi:MFS family permease